jgi:hypothetical protein
MMLVTLNDPDLSTVVCIVVGSSPSVLITIVTASPGAQFAPLKTIVSPGKYVLLSVSTVGSPWRLLERDVLVENWAAATAATRIKTKYTYTRGRLGFSLRSIFGLLGARKADCGFELPKYRRPVFVVFLSPHLKAV